MPGRSIVVASWVSVVLLAAVAVPHAAGVDALAGATLAVSVAAFLVSLPVWAYAFAAAVARTTRGDDVAVSSLFFLAGSAPGPVRAHLMGALAASVALAAATMFTSPYTVLVPMLPLGLAGAWAARHGTYPPRPARPDHPAGRRARGGRR